MTQQSLPAPVVVLRSQVQEHFTPLTSDPNKSVRAKAIRAILALMKDGRCNLCFREVENYNDLYRWHFDHLDDLQYHRYSPRTQHLQFRISGKDIATRSLGLVIDHCRQDTQLLCKDCHFKKNMRTYREAHRAARMAQHMRDLGVGII